MKTVKYMKSKIASIKTVEGETIEQKVERIVNNKEPIKDGAPEIYTERKQGVVQAYNIRTDRWEVAINAMDKVQKSLAAKREEYYKSKEEPKKEERKEEINPVEPVQATKKE